MAAGQKGVMVRAVSPIADTSNHLQPDDVLMRFDGVQIASDGTVPFRFPLPLSPSLLGMLLLTANHIVSTRSCLCKVVW